MAIAKTRIQPIVLPVMPPANGKVVPPVVSKWKSAPPAIADGKVVFTAPDADSVHCIQLRDGKPLWRKSQQKGDLYLAGVVDGRVLIVAEEHPLFDFKDGKQLWSVDFADLPSGQGVASKGIYYLPLTKGILPIDLAKGESKKLIAAKDGPPGNLVFYDGMLLSQTVTSVSAYPLARYGGAHYKGLDVLAGAPADGRPRQSVLARSANRPVPMTMAGGLCRNAGAAGRRMRNGVCRECLKIPLDLSDISVRLYAVK